jgi:hypothetical protein
MNGCLVLCPENDHWLIIRDVVTMFKGGHC